MSEAEKLESEPFALVEQEDDDTSDGFYPEFTPETIRPRKVRNLDRTENFCKGENVSDEGAENREIHVTGRMVGPEKDALDAVADSGMKFDMASATWSGRVYVSEVEYEGPDGWDPDSGYFYYTYTIDLVEAGMERPEPEGVVEQPNVVDFSNTFPGSSWNTLDELDEDE